MKHIEAPIVRELRQVIVELKERIAAQERQIEELRGAVVALMEPNMPRILRTPGGIMVLDKKMPAPDGRSDATPKFCRNILHTRLIQPC